MKINPLFIYLFWLPLWPWTWAVETKSNSNCSQETNQFLDDGQCCGKNANKTKNRLMMKSPPAEIESPAKAFPAGDPNSG